MTLDIKRIDNGVRFTAKIVSGSSRTSIEGSLDTMLKIKVAAVAEKGKANKELVNFLAKKLDINKKDIKIISGETNPVKTLEISNVNTEKILTLNN